MLQWRVQDVGNSKATGHPQEIYRHGIDSTNIEDTYYRTGEVLHKSFEAHVTPPQAPDDGQGTVYVLGLKAFVQLFFTTPNIFLLE